ncbi:hypothetical protein [Arenibaculum pallidiluteum]|uniref:hypothetical protein n=1 Tax=Arenibaculum pallidiluteum TaxID=2812559 RepID=UPI001A97A48F|nr:hypothetical protein [Arenibaculum pallidiluteum]
MRLALKVAAGIVVPLAAALALTAYMNFERFAKTYREVMQSRAAAVLLDAQETIEGGITLGVSAASLTSLQGTLTRYVENGDGILGLAVVDADGAVTVASEGAPLDGLALGAVWESRDLVPVPTAAGGRAAIAAPIRDARGVRAGTLAVIYSTTGADAALAEVRRILVLVGIGVGLVCGAAALALASYLLRPVSNEFGTMAGRLAEVRARRRGTADYGGEVARVVLGSPRAAP